MNPLDRAARRNPALFAFGTEALRRLAPEEEAAAPFEDRLRSVWGYLVRRSRRFVATLSGRERAHLGPDDLVDAIVVALLEKDARWDPGRGRYITFAEQVARNVMVAERERARVVRAPSNARSRLQKYRDLDREGKLSESKRITMHSIEAALGEVECVRPAAGPTTDRDGTPRAVAAEEARDRELRDLTSALRTVESPIHAHILARAWGLHGGEELTPAQIAAGLPGGLDARKVRTIRARAEAALKSRIQQLRDTTT